MVSPSTVTRPSFSGSYSQMARSSSFKKSARSFRCCGGVVSHNKGYICTLKKKAPGRLRSSAGDLGTKTAQVGGTDIDAASLRCFVPGLAVVIKVITTKENTAASTLLLEVVLPRAMRRAFHACGKASTNIRVDAEVIHDLVEAPGHNSVRSCMKWGGARGADATPGTSLRQPWTTRATRTTHATQHCAPDVIQGGETIARDSITRDSLLPGRRGGIPCD